MTDNASPRPTLGDLANRILAAANEDERRKWIAQLARGTNGVEQIVAIADRFLAHGPVGQLAFLEWIVRVRGSVPDAVLARIGPLLPDRAIPASTRIAAAGCLLRSLPDRFSSLRPIVRALTAGLGPLRALERLRQLQHHIDRSRALDALIERREKRVEVDCPRCGVHLPRADMLKHLWHAHDLSLERHKIRSRLQLVEELRVGYAELRDTTALDRAALLAGPTALRGWVAASEPSAEEIAPLLADAEERRAGLCPGCYGEVPEAVAPMPPPLTLARGRLAGEGYIVEVGTAELLRTATVSDPTGTLQSGPDHGRALSPRGAATLVAGAVLLVAVTVAAFAPPRRIAPTPLVLRTVATAAVAYAAVWIARRPLPDAAERAIDIAWTVLAPQLAKGMEGGRFLTRLCRTSLGRGDPNARLGALSRVVALAANTPTDEGLRLLAAASLLQVDDSGHLGRDRVAGVAALVAAGFRGERSIAYAEYVAECFLDRTPPPDATDVARLRILLMGAAFDAGLKPRDLIDLWPLAPSLRRAMAVDQLHRVGLLYGVWSIGLARRWERVAPADSVYDLCKNAPNISGRILAEYPDLLLYFRPGGGMEEQLGPVLICARGVVVGGAMTSDPSADVNVVEAGRFGGLILTFGRHRIPISAAPPADFVDTIGAWLRFRVSVLLPFIDGFLERSSPEASSRILAPYLQRCGYCGTISAIAAGTIGMPVSIPQE